MYHIFMRCYPQPDEDITEEWELMPFTRIDRAKAFAQDLEKFYSAEEWNGHRLYKSKYYAMEV